jgi:endonuclease YncB( thermonuclease family)
LVTRRLLTLLFVVALAQASDMTSAAQSPEDELTLPSDLSVAEWGRVIEVIDGDTLVLATGKQVRLVGIQAPKLPLGRRGFTAWPLAPEAKVALEVLTLGREVGLAEGDGATRDRHDRRLAHLVTREGLWIQGRLLEMGLARVYSFSDNRAGVAQMLSIERAARASGRGIWSHPFYGLRKANDHDALWPLIDSFQIIAGRVAAVHEAKSATYINFGEDWRSDFSLRIASADRRAFRDAGIDLTALAGKLVRVRGWLSAYNGPSLKVDHPEQLEILD